jgi:hypothetical protein
VTALTGMTKSRKKNGMNNNFLISIKKELLFLFKKLLEKEKNK